MNAAVRTTVNGRSWFPILIGVLAVFLGVAVGLLVTQVYSSIRLVVIAMGIVALAATVIRAEWGLLVLAFITYTRFSDVAIEFHGAPSVAKSFVVLLLFAILLRWAVYGERPQGWQRATVLAGAYAVVYFASLLYAADMTRALDAALDLIKDGIIAVIATILLFRSSTLRWLVWTLLAAGLFLGSLSVYQYLTGTFDSNYAGFAQSPILNIVGESEGHRVAGPIGDPNFYAQIMLVLVPLAVDRMLGEKNRWLQVLGGIVLAVCVMTVFLTFSRGAFVAVVIMGVLLVIYRPPRPAEWLVMIAVALVLLRFMPESYADRIKTLANFIPGQEASTHEEVSFRGRTSEFGVAWMMFADHPLLGVGAGNFPVYYQEYSRRLGIDPRSGPRQPHNLYMQVASETGLVGLVVFGFILWSMLRSVWKAWRGFTLAGDLDTARMVAAMGIGIVGYLSAALFIHAAYPRYFWLLAGIALGLTHLARRELGLRYEIRPGKLHSGPSRNGWGSP